MSVSQSPAFPRSRRAVAVLLLLISILYWASMYVYLPTLPTYLQTKTGDLAAVGVVLAQYGLWQAVVRLPLGITADWLGRRKPFVIAGLGLAALGAWVLGAGDTIPALAAGRAITGLAAATWVPLIVVFSSLFPSDQAIRATALMTFAASLGRVLATSVTGTLNNWGGYALPFHLAAGIAALACLLASLPPEPGRQRRAPSLSSVRAIVARRDVLLPSLLSAVGNYATWAVPFGFVPILARQLGATDGTQSLLMSLQIAVVTLGSLVAAAVSDRIGSHRMVRASFVVLAVGIAGTALAPSLPFLVATQLILGVAQGMSYPVLMGMSIQFVADEQRTTAMGLHQAVYALGMFGGPWLSGLLADAWGLRPMFGFTAVVCLGAGLWLLRLCPKGQPDCR